MDDRVVLVLDDSNFLFVYMCPFYYWEEADIYGWQSRTSHMTP